MWQTGSFATLKSNRDFAAATDNFFIFLRVLGPELNAIEQTNHKQQRAPPNIRVQVIKDNGDLSWRSRQLIEPGSQNQGTIN
jgi:hypothetical protein